MYRNKTNLYDKHTILFQGDSITDTKRDKSNHLDYGNGYVKIVSEVLKNHCSGINIINKGQAQDKVEDIEKRIEKDFYNLKNIKPNIISILAGINNIGSITNNLNHTNLLSLEKSYSNILEEYKLLYPSSSIIVCEPFSLPVKEKVKNWYTRKRILYDTHSILQNLSIKYQATYLPLQSLFEEASQIKPYKFWLYDGTHPTQDGHKIIAQAWLKHVLNLDYISSSTQSTPEAK